MVYNTRSYARNKLRITLNEELQSNIYNKQIIINTLN